MGSKIDFKTFAILALALIVGTMTVTLVAQRDNVSSVSGTGEQAAATRSVADATRAVAQSNQEIAVSINKLAEAVEVFGKTYERVATGQPSGAMSSRTTTRTPPRAQSNASDDNSDSTSSWTSGESSSTTAADEDPGLLEAEEVSVFEIDEN